MYKYILRQVLVDQRLSPKIETAMGRAFKCLVDLWKEKISFAQFFWNIFDRGFLGLNNSDLFVEAYGQTHKFVRFTYSQLKVSLNLFKIEKVGEVLNSKIAIVTIPERSLSILPLDEL